MHTAAAARPAGRRSGRPLIYSLTEIAVLVLVTAALIATAALPAMSRHPNYAEAKAVGTAVHRR